ncbi:tetratricopeptide repeat protein [Flavobacterium cerinum]|uniref:Tetratricopeptide repeat protein n=1 Tax=Flavobacterium cerinum TaxID=2502784 RepID=A0ABY5IPJ0_9FLAO|nr:tetratricopeptide repeat protein [Flavobacterium cerinum]UUC44107.1 tetratricopeptide repeat protein [Flavobacterium cerinum]
MKQFRALCFLSFFLLIFSQAITAQQNDRKTSYEAEIDALNRMGLTYNKQGNVEKAEPLFQQAIALSRKHKYNKKLGQSLYNLSSLYTETANYETAIQLGEECIEVLQKYDDKETIARCLINLETCWRQHGILINAMTYADSAVKALRPVKNDTLLELALWRQGEIYREINTALAIPMLKEALVLAQKIPELYNLDNIYNSLGQCYIEPYMEVYDAAIAERYFKMALEAALKYDKKEVNYNRIQYGKICTANGKYKEAEQQLKLVYENAAVTNNTDEQSVAAFCLSEVYFAVKDFKTAYRYLKKHESLEELYATTQKKSTTAKMAFNFKTGRVETQNKLLKQQRELQRLKQEQVSFRNNVKIGVSVAITLFLVTVTLALYRFNKKKNLLLSKKSATLRQQLLLTQMSPHFITSSIESIQNLIREDKPDIAATYLSKFTRLTRQILESSTGDSISVDEEIAIITNYLTVQQLLHTGGFSFTVDDDGMDTETIYIPPMLTQPLLANAVKRVLAGSGQHSVAVQLLLKNNKLLIQVSDSGGSLKPGELQRILDSKDISITAERLSTPVTVENVSLEDGTAGVMTQLEIDYISDD